MLLTDDELHSLAWLWRAADYMMGEASSIYLPHYVCLTPTTSSSTNTR
ncbi:P22AR C-terminal domain-containing protein [Aeromonas enteropelogenes]